eukprot:9459338-Pyramimonas_sp.AAC.1
MCIRDSVSWVGGPCPASAWTATTSTRSSSTLRRSQTTGMGPMDYEHIIVWNSTSKRAEINKMSLAWRRRTFASAW